MLESIEVFIDNIKEFVQDKNNFKLVIIIVSGIVIFISFVFALLLFNAKKKKYRKSLELLRNRIQNLKQKEVIKNYSTYDNLKNDLKLGMLVLRWKKEIEKLVREIDAQYSMLDVLEDAISQNNYQYFTSLLESFYKDIKDLEDKADKLNEEITEYVDIASDNRKYINKYHEMVFELKEKYKSNFRLYESNKEKIEEYLQSIESKFEECNNYIEKSEFVEADNIASLIFKDIKILDNYMENAPKIIHRINTAINPKFIKLKTLSDNFNEEEFKLMNLKFNEQYDIYNDEVQNIIKEINSFNINNYDTQLKEIDDFLNAYIGKLESECDNKNFIIKNIETQKENITKVENTAKNFISIFKIVKGSYNISEKDINTIDQMLINIDSIKIRLSSLSSQFEQNNITFEEIKYQLDKTSREITKISQTLDSNIYTIDEIYSDEKKAREKIALMTEKINGTKKYIKYANLEEQGKYLQVIRSLNLEISNLYILLSEFPIDIVKLNESLESLFNNVEKVTQDINGIIYKTLLTEFILLYANRYFYDKKYQKDLLIAENLFYNNNYTKAYDKVISILEAISPVNKKVVLEKYQEKFSELFK